MSTFLTLIVQLLLMSQTCFLSNEYQDNQAEFLQFATAATNDYRSAVSSGSYEVLITRKKYSRIEKVRFYRSEFGVEMFDDMTVLSDQAGVNWQENATLLNELKPVLIGATGETPSYRYGLEFKENRRDQSEISQMEVFSGEKGANHFLPSIYNPFTIGNCGFAVDAVNNGVLHVTEWRYDQARKLWYGKFKQLSSDLEFAVYFDPIHRRIVKLTLFSSQTAVYTKDLEYSDKLKAIRIYRHTSRDSIELLETWYFSSYKNESIDPATFRISNFGHKEPVLLEQTETRLFSFLGWSILPILGITILVLSRWISAGKES